MDWPLIIVNILTVALLLAGGFLICMGLPGSILILATALGYGIFDGFAHLSGRTLLAVLAMAAAAELIEFAAGALWAKKEAASKQALAAALAGAVVGGVVGTGVLPLIGSIGGAVAGGFAGSYLAEYWQTRDTEQAARVARGAAKGQLAGILAKMSLMLAAVVLILAKMPWR